MQMTVCEGLFSLPFAESLAPSSQSPSPTALPLFQRPGQLGTAAPPQPTRLPLHSGQPGRPRLPAAPRQRLDLGSPPPPSHPRGPRPAPRQGPALAPRHRASVLEPWVLNLRARAQEKGRQQTPGRRGLQSAPLRLRVSEGPASSDQSPERSPTFICYFWGGGCGSGLRSPLRPLHGARGGTISRGGQSTESRFSRVTSRSAPCALPCPSPAGQD